MLSSSASRWIWISAKRWWRCYIGCAERTTKARCPATAMPSHAARTLVAGLITVAVLASALVPPTRVVGSIHGTVYHWAGCASERQILESNLRVWPSAEAAILDGRRACVHCERRGDTAD